MLIGVDWGTSNLRAFRFDEAGAVLETRRSPAGMAAVQDRAFEAALRAVIGDWLQAPASLLLCGMVGAREGWREAPYCPCPADLAALAAAALPLDTALGQAWIVPGLKLDAQAARRDIMRGEETQIFGAVEPGASGLVIAPGTHSKWARLDAGAVTAIRTFMTGELFALLKAHSILGRLIDGDAHDQAAFAKGVERARAEPALSSILFSARVEGLLGGVAPQALASYLSGLLIGAEVCAGLAEAGAGPVRLIAASGLAERYKTALAAVGAADLRLVDGEAAAAAGLWRIAAAKRLV